MFFANSSKKQNNYVKDIILNLYQSDGILWKINTDIYV